MNELINIKNEKQILDVIGKAINQGKYEIAACILSELNDELVKYGKHPYSIQEILFRNWRSLLTDCFSEKAKSIYFAEFEDGSVKVGISKKPEERLKHLSFAKGSELKRYCYTSPNPKASKIEYLIHTDFKEKRKKGEYFNLNYDDLLMAVKDKYDLDVSVSSSIYKKHEKVAI